MLNLLRSDFMLVYLVSFQPLRNPKFFTSRATIQISLIDVEEALNVVGKADRLTVSHHQTMPKGGYSSRSRRPDFGDLFDSNLP